MQENESILYIILVGAILPRWSGKDSKPNASLDKGDPKRHKRSLPGEKSELLSIAASLHPLL